MRHVLTDGAAELDRFASSRVLVALDYDGTLAPICGDPAAAAASPTTRELLRRLAELYDCAVISGRAHDDVSRRLAGIDLMAVVGNHGLEPWDATDGIAAEVTRWRQALEPRLGALGGVEIEDKRYSLALHWRRAGDRSVARAAVHEAAGALGPLRAIGGKEVLNLLPQGATNKGMALQRLRAHLGSECAIYVGDDETDEDVFASGAAGLLGIRVGESDSSHASWYLRGQEEVDVLLSRLIAIAEGQGLPAWSRGAALGG